MLEINVGEACKSDGEIINSNFFFLRKITQKIQCHKKTLNTSKEKNSVVPGLDKPGVSQLYVHESVGDVLLVDQLGDPSLHVREVPRGPDLHVEVSVQEGLALVGGGLEPLEGIHGVAVLAVPEGLLQEAAHRHLLLLLTPPPP